MRIQDIAAFAAVREAGLTKLLPSRPRIAVGMGTCGSGNGAESVYHAFASAIDARGLAMHLAPVGCFGYCAEEPLVNAWVPGRPLLILRQVQPNHVDEILAGLGGGQPPPSEIVLCKIEAWDHLTGHVKYGYGYPDVPDWHEVPFFAGQVKTVLRNCGLINPDDIEEYIAIGGYQALYKVLIDQNPAGVIEQVKAAKLRGRGGAGYLTGNKWEFLHKATDPEKYIVCNADEGDPGAYMNRNEIESDPHALLEGMLIAGYVTGASRGIIYVRAEYPLAVLRLERAVEQARAYGILGDNVLGRGFSFEIEIVGGAGAFVCGEETGLIASLEGHSGRPRTRPPFPAQKGLYGKPTNIGNVETWYNIAPIVSKGAAWFTEIGSAKSPGTKVFSLVGKVRNTGLVEMPLGTPLATFIYDIGGGGTDGREIKAVQTGGPSGGCIPADMLDTPVDYETLAQLGSIMGSGGMVVMDEDNCMVDVARYFIEFTHSESCGKCIPCRVGLDQALRILNRCTLGKATHADLKMLDELCRMVRDTSLCGLGQSAPNPVLTTLRHFRHEFEDHIVAKRCRAGVCEELALSPCENSCPLHMNIPRFLQLYKEGQLEDAFLSVIFDNPLPASTGRVCQHPCDDRCRRAGVDEAVNMRDVHRLIADQVLLSGKFDAMVERVLERRLDATGREVAIVGAGPTGLACAFYLALLGHSVTVYDSRAAAGGMLRYAIPEYRLPKAVLDREIQLIERLGVKFQFNVNVGEAITLTELAHQYDAIFLAIGTWKEAWVYLPGTELSGVIPALPFLEAVARDDHVPVGKNVVVIGGGNAAIDSARTARRMGADVTIVYRRERQDMPAIPEEIQGAEHEGARIVYRAAPHRIVGDKNGHVRAIEAVRTKPGEFDTSGRRRPVLTDEVIRFACDTVILAVGETVDPDFLRASGLKLREAGSGTIEVDRYSLETSRERFYAGGDLISGASNVSNAMGYGKDAARAIDEKLMGQERFTGPFPEFTYAMEPPETPDEGGRHVPAEMPAAQRVLGFAEVSLGLTSVAAVREASRCLRCDIRSAER
ncbi:MAG TPA: NADH-ubiquinone oxidoreductase-F iron-sulfur binding region domain-containing protein [Chthonomonadales bacterium]|nr:NADH-ubiquinone oxidoreductase-F iron-sulfur binding region domain-containing protein [Chthonomonadales bacterium]